MKGLAYRILAAYVRFSLWVYFRRLKHVGVAEVPKQGPVILVPNHQNAFLDALVVGAGLPRPTWFLARADVFKRPWAAKLLNFLKIMPIFRFRDGHAAMRKNEQAIQNCVNLLKQGEVLLLFPEGNHNEPWTMRDLQKGFAQIALMYVDQTGKDIPIVPVGIHFENHQAMGTRVLVRYGQALSVQEVIGETEGRERFTPLLRQVAERIRSMILTVPLDEHYPERRDYLMRNRVPQDDLAMQVDWDRKLMQSWKPGQADLPPPAYPYAWGSKWLSPVYTYARLVHAIPELIIRRIIDKKIKDKQFVGSVKVAVGMFLIPAYYLLATAVFLLIVQNPWWTLAFAGSMPFSGMMVAYLR